MSELLNNNILLTIILVIGTFVTLQVSKYFLRKIGLTKDGNEKRVYYISKSLNIVVLVVAVFLCAAIWSM